MFADFTYYNRHTLYSRYTPLSIGMIAQYSKQKFGDDIDVSLFKSIDKFFDKAKETPPDVVGLSIYFWNKAINQYAVKKLRQMFGKEVIIVVGGPSIDSNLNEQFNFLTDDFPHVDAAITNEGELGDSEAADSAAASSDSSCIALYYALAASSPIGRTYPERERCIFNASDNSALSKSTAGLTGFRTSYSNSTTINRIFNP